MIPEVEWKPINTILYELTQLVDYLNELNIGSALGLRTDFTMFQLCLGFLIVVEVATILKDWGYIGDEWEYGDDEDFEDVIDVGSLDEYDDD